MSYGNVIVLLLFALTQCRTQTVESTTNTEAWYAANVITDGTFSPKPISELFTTDITFSTANPIVVLPVSTSTTPPTTTTTTTTTTTIRPSTNPPTTSIQPQVQTNPPSTSTLNPTPSTRPTAEPQPVIPSNQIPINHIHIHNLPPFQNVPNYRLVPIIQEPVVQSASYEPTRISSTSPPQPQKNTTNPCSMCLNQTRPCPSCPNQPRNPAKSMFIRIRMFSPRGPTNITINPINATTRRPNRNREGARRRENRNDYDECIRVCGNGRKRICAAPVTSRPVDADSLRGFPSVCHLACHNNFRSFQYEKLLEGRCGRLRTRIRPVDSNDKIKRDELNKTQYQVVQEPHTIIEFEPAV